MKKWIKKINIFMCCLLLCFCSVVAKPKEVQALIGVDDLALATIGLMGLSLLGIGITENINDNYDTYKKVALNTYNSMCDFVGQAWVDMCLSAYNTGQFALTQLNNVKSNIQDWYNSFLTLTTAVPYDSLSSIAYNTVHQDSIDVANVLNLSTCSNYDSALSRVNLAQQLADNYGFLFLEQSSNKILIVFKNSSYNYCFGFSYVSNNNIKFYPIYKNSSNVFKFAKNCYDTYFFNSSNNSIENMSTIISSPTSQIYTNMDCYYSSLSSKYGYDGALKMTDQIYSITYIDCVWGGSLELDPPNISNNPLDGFAKLNDMVKGLDETLVLDPISIGALNGTFDITDTAITSYGTISTNVLDLSNVHDDSYTFPLTGSLENTLDDTNTMIFNPTLDDEITNVGDITVTYPQNPSIPTLKDVDKIENIDDLKFDWTTVFPFCIPFDFIKFLKVLCSDPITPEVNWNYDLVGFKGTLNLSLKDYNDVASLLRKMETFSFILFLIFKTRDLIRG